MNPEPREDEHEDRPALQITQRNLIVLGGFLVASLAALYFLLPQVAGLDDTWKRIEDGRPAWISAALVFMLGMFAGYVATFRAVFVRAGPRIGWPRATRSRWPGSPRRACSRPAAPAGSCSPPGRCGARGCASARSRTRRSPSSSSRTCPTAWRSWSAVRPALGVFSGANPFSLTFVPAVVGVVLLALALAVAFIPTDLQRRILPVARKEGRLGRLTRQLATIPASGSAGVRDALEHLRSRDPALLGAVIFWGSQIAILWAAFHAFGDAPPLAVLVQAFFVGMLGNLLPMPGGVGGVEGGMIGAFAAFGVDSGLAVVAVLVYRAFTFWLPLLPGVFAYFKLRRTVETWKHEAASAAV